MPYPPPPGNDLTPARCDHNRPWGQCDHCAAIVRAAEERAAEAIETARNLSEADRDRLRAQINQTRLPWQK